MSLPAKYQQIGSDLIEDAAQLQLLAQLETIRASLIQEVAKRQRFLRLSKPKAVPGVYLWGGVGIGKTFLLNLFFENLPFPQKKRMHFYKFMQFIHQELKRFNGHKDPLQLIGKAFAKENYVLYLDEFFVDNIVDAMLLGNLLTVLFNEGVCILSTSNIAPDFLYERGLQREQFLPAIALIKQRMQVWHLATKVDYRQRYANRHQHLQQIEWKLEQYFQRISEAENTTSEPLTIANRSIPCRKRGSNIAWFDFNHLCRIPRSHQDYLELAAQFDHIILTNIPSIAAHEKNTIRLLISFIDVMYDSQTKFLFSCVTSVREIYTSGDMIFQFQRTLSRLLEMQNKYLDV